ncbi:hypothetical protein C5C66_01005 [Rathayibacter toxicus]|uniref:Uncharacterized protein n=2 Tax=Rathayibacter toxicus TaxID=145458 RepID=A0A0U1PR17_9MICO|nr:hypothetical protein [Rathayibacter toxicus]ALS57258.1 hypothetical protein APU90_05300 [Rathayibacter toxicus]KKM44379.1 hypothetical protein VT73_10065 [Rathayibacter toxicus]PPG24867.1 hypothetical protein C5D15_00990 [Rathayibacter toxicus]PPG48322.1 hypothetical protein C5D16_01005 [Rathayibacter toxicus]PPH25619.1 hypothetical protein C5D17_00975 [Rathayibacter toxicus]
MGSAVTMTMPAFAINGDAESASSRDAARAVAVAVANPQSFVATGVAQQRLTRDTFATEAKPEVSVPTADLSAITGSTGESARAAAGISGTWITPVSGHITSGYGPRPDPPVAGVNLFHKGTDIAGAWELRSVPHPAAR